MYVSSIASLYTGPDAKGGEILDSTDTDPKPAERSLYARGKIAADGSPEDLANRWGEEHVTQHLAKLSKVPLGNVFLFVVQLVELV